VVLQLCSIERLLAVSLKDHPRAAPSRQRPLRSARVPPVCYLDKPNPPGEIRVERFGWTFCLGDKVMHAENDYDKDVYNGDLGVVSYIGIEEGELSVDFDGRDVNYGFGELDELVLAMQRPSTRARARNIQPRRKAAGAVSVYPLPDSRSLNVANPAHSVIAWFT
jgi:ATP-dependent RecD-like DNA helicase SH3 domain